MGYAYLFGPSIAPGEPAAERDRFDSAVLLRRLGAALVTLNPQATSDALDEAVRLLTTVSSPVLLLTNRAFHRQLVDGVSVPVRRPDGTNGYEMLQVIDWEHPERNDFLVVKRRYKPGAELNFAACSTG